MEKQEKVSFILEQMRLNLLHGDFVRAQIVSKKVTTKYFEDEKALVSWGYGEVWWFGEKWYIGSG